MALGALALPPLGIEPTHQRKYTMTSKFESNSANSSRPQTPRRTPGTWMLFCAGTICMAIGTLVAFGPRYMNGVMPDVLWYAKIIGRLGFNGETIGSLGVILFGLGIVSSQLRKHAAWQLMPSKNERSIGQLCTVIGDMNKRLKAMEKQNGSAAKQRLAIMETVQQQHLETVELARTDPQNDAMFRLAASLDQLGARVDKRIGESTSVLQNDMNELCSLVETSTDRVQSEVEISAQQLTSLINDATQVEDELPAAAPEPAPERGNVCLPEEEKTGEGDLDIYVEFEEEEQEGSHGLGLLDEIDDEANIALNTAPTPPHFGSIDLANTQAPLPSPEQAPETRQPRYDGGGPGY